MELTDNRKDNKASVVTAETNGTEQAVLPPTNIYKRESSKSETEKLEDEVKAKRKELERQASLVKKKEIERLAEEAAKSKETARLAEEEAKRKEAVR